MKVRVWDACTGERSWEEQPAITVAELITALQKLPPDYEVGTESDIGRFPLLADDLQVKPELKLVLI